MLDLFLFEASILFLFTLLPPHSARNSCLEISSLTAPETAEWSMHPALQTGENQCHFGFFKPGSLNTLNGYERLISQPLLDQRVFLNSASVASPCVDGAVCDFGNAGITAPCLALISSEEVKPHSSSFPIAGLVCDPRSVFLRDAFPWFVAKLQVGLPCCIWPPTVPSYSLV